MSKRITKSETDAEKYQQKQHAFEQFLPVAIDEINRHCAGLADELKARGVEISLIASHAGEDGTLMFYRDGTECFAPQVHFSAVPYYGWRPFFSGSDFRVEYPATIDARPAYPAFFEAQARRCLKLPKDITYAADAQHFAEVRFEQDGGGREGWASTDPGRTKYHHYDAAGNSKCSYQRQHGPLHFAPDPKQLTSAECCSSCDLAILKAKQPAPVPRQPAKPKQKAQQLSLF